MTREQFLQSMDKLVELPRGTLKGSESLNELENWNSLAIITFIALADSNNGHHVSPRQIMACATVSDLLNVARVEQ
jgi:acyl carrier protein